MTTPWWENEHGYHPATEVTAPLHDKIRQAAIEFSRVIQEVGEQAGLRKDHHRLVDAHDAVHQARMWANMAIAVYAAPLATEEQRTVPNDPYGQDRRCHNCAGRGGTLDADSMKIEQCTACLGSGCQHVGSLKIDGHCGLCEQDSNCKACQERQPTPKPDSEESVFEPTAPHLGQFHQGAHTVDIPRDDIISTMTSTDGHVDIQQTCANCKKPVTYREKPEHGSLNAHWGPKGWTCESGEAT